MCKYPTRWNCKRAAPATELGWMLKNTSHHISIYAIAKFEYFVRWLWSSKNMSRNDLVHQFNFHHEICRQFQKSSQAAIQRHKKAYLNSSNQKSYTSTWLVSSEMSPIGNLIPETKSLIIKLWDSLFFGLEKLAPGWTAAQSCWKLSIPTAVCTGTSGIGSDCRPTTGCWIRVGWGRPSLYIFLFSWVCSGGGGGMLVSSRLSTYWINTHQLTGLFFISRCFFWKNCSAGRKWTGWGESWLIFLS